ncbi:IS3 family transposase [Spirosoma daeguense]
MANPVRRIHDAHFKTKVVLEAFKGHKTLAQLSSEFGIHAQMITDWKRQALDGMPSLFEITPSKPTLSVEQREQIEAPLFQQIGQLKVENNFLKKKITDELKTDLRSLIDPTHTRLSVNQQCALLGLARSTYYYQPLGESAQNLALMEQIDRLFTARPELGVERMCQELTSPEQPINVKRVRRLMRLMGLEAVGPKPNLSKAQPGHTIYPYLLRGVAIERSNQVWSTDITYVPMANGFLYLCAIIDWFSRFILSWRLSNTLLADFCVDALEESLNKWGKPEIFNTDQDSQFTSNNFLNPLISSEVAISMDSKGRALDNIFIERFWRTIKYEHLYLTSYQDGRRLYQGLNTYFRFYNQERKHQSLGYQTPAEWYERGRGNGKVQLLSPTPSSLI